MKTITYKGKSYRFVSYEKDSRSMHDPCTHCIFGDKRGNCKDYMKFRELCKGGVFKPDVLTLKIKQL